MFSEELQPPSSLVDVEALIFSQFPVISLTNDLFIRVLEHVTCELIVYMTLVS